MTLYFTLGIRHKKKSILADRCEADPHPPSLVPVRGNILRYGVRHLCTSAQYGTCEHSPRHLAVQKTEGEQGGVLVRENPEGENEPPTKRSKKTDDAPVSEIDFTTIL